MIFKTERKRPEPWSLYRQKARFRWTIPFFGLEWFWEWVAYVLSGWAFVEVLEYLGTLSLLVAVIFYFADGPNRRKQKHYQAWQVIDTAQGKGGSGGRVEALQELLADGVSLVGIDVSDAFLRNVELNGAQLVRSNFRGADVRNASFRKANMQYADLTTANFRGSDFRRANLENASLRDTDLNGSNLSSSDLRETDLSRADLRNCDLQGIDWEDITDIRLANIFGVRDAPTGFVQWALGHGAVLIESDPDWFEQLQKDQR
jgi:hypothetical protein